VDPFEHQPRPASQAAENGGSALIEKANALFFKLQREAKPPHLFCVLRIAFRNLVAGCPMQLSRST